MIYAIWYPSGGFGHFINALLLLKGKNFERPKTEFKFSDNGDSHSLFSSFPKYLHNPKEYPIITDNTEIKKTVLIDTGINNESKNFFQCFPNATVIKICYDDWTWSIVAKTMIEKAMHQPLDNIITVDKILWQSDDHWCQREKYYLYLKDHKFRSSWREDNDSKNIFINELLNFESFTNKFLEFDIELEVSALDLWKSWIIANSNYLNPFFVASDIVNNLTKTQSLSHINDLWTQAIVNYFIWLKYKFEVPAWDYKDWFSSTEDISTMLTNNGVTV